jgi:HNH endonuclease
VSAYEMLSERFIDKLLVMPNGCWEWTGSRSTNGYGQLWNGVRLVVAHRIAYELFVGPIPAGLELDHLCRVRHCVNPGHLEAVTHSENALRAPHVIRRRTQTHCKRGHSLAEAYINAKGYRCCRVCRRLHHATYRARKAARPLPHLEVL